MSRKNHSDMDNILEVNPQGPVKETEEILSEEEIQRREQLQDEAMRNFAIAQETDFTDEALISGKPEPDVPERNKVRPISPEAREKDDGSGKTGKVVRFFLNLIVGATLIYGAYLLGRNGYKLNIGPKPTASPYPTSAVQPEKPNEFTIVDLDKYVNSLQASQIAPFTASVEDYYGYECLCLTSGVVKIYYRNEYPAGYTDPKRVVIDNNIFRTEMTFNYDLSGDIESLVPMIGSFGQDNSRQLLFIDYEDGYPVNLKFIDAEKLFNYGSISFENCIRGCFSTSFSEEPGTQGQASRNLMTFTFSGIPYTYSVSSDTLRKGLLLGNEVITLRKGFSLDFTDSGISFTAQVVAGDDEYLGVVSGSAIIQDTSFAVSGVRFGSYATAYEAGYGEDKVITPRNAPLPEYLTIISRNNERFFLPILDDIKQRSINFTDLVYNDAKGTYEYIVDGKIMSHCGVDVSKFQGDIDWEKAKAWGVEFAIIRLGYRGYGEGTLEIDEYFEKNIQGATAAGIKVGIYFFSQALNAQEAKEEADFVLEKIKDYKIDYPVIIDTEDITTANARANSLTIKERTVVCRVFCDTIKAGGYRPMIYSSVRYMLTGIDLTQLDDIDRWFAYYGTGSKFPYDFTIFQYSETGKVDGFTTDVDLDISLIDYSSPE